MSQNNATNPNNFSQETEEKYAIMSRNLQEVLGNINYMKQLFEEGKEPKGYFGTAPTGIPHIAYFLQMAKIRDYISVGCNMTILVADIHAMLDDLKCPFEKIALRTEVYIRILKQMLSILGTDLSKVTFVKGSDYQLRPEITMDLYKLCSVTSVSRAKKGGTEVVKMTSDPKLTNLLYVPLQSLDEIYINSDFEASGVDQRHIFGYSLEYLPKIGHKKNYCYLMTPMISGLSVKKSATQQLSQINPQSSIEDDIANKMSSSVDSSKIDLLAQPDVIKKVISKAYCLDGDAEDNSVLRLIKNLIFKLTDKFHTVKWDKNIKAVVAGKIYTNYDDLHTDVVLGSTNGGIHPADLKQSLSDFLIDFLRPIREEFESEENRKLLIDAYGIF